MESLFFQVSLVLCIVINPNRQKRTRQARSLEAGQSSGLTLISTEERQTETTGEPSVYAQSFLQSTGLLCKDSPESFEVIAVVLPDMILSLEPIYPVLANFCHQSRRVLGDVPTVEMVALAA